MNSRAKLGGFFFKILALQHIFNRGISQWEVTHLRPQDCKGHKEGVKRKYRKEVYFTFIYVIEYYLVSVFGCEQ